MADLTLQPADQSEHARERPPLLVFAVFLTIAISILAAAHHYFVSRLVHEPAWPAPWASVAEALIWLAAVSIVATPFAERTLSPHTTKLIAWPSFLWMGASFYLLIGLGLSDAWFALTGAHGVDVARTRAELVIAVALVLVALGMRSVLAGPYVKEVPIALRRWPKALDGYRIVQISDIHIGPLLHQAFAQRVVDLVHSGRPDLIVVTGDLVDGGVRQLEQEVAPFGQLLARHGTYFITGNHDFYSGASHWTQKITELGMRPLRNTHVSIADEVTGSAFVLAGVDDPTGRRMGGGGDDVSAALLGMPGEHAVVLLAHDPRTFEKASTSGVDLQISGHTHGGQMFPFGWLVRLSTRFVAGLYRVADAQIYVSRGTGFWGPPMRLLAPAEVSVLVLRAAD